MVAFLFFFFFQAEDGIRDLTVTGVQTCALPICWRSRFSHCLLFNPTDSKSAAYNPLLEVRRGAHEVRDVQNIADIRSEEHTSELQSQSNLVCRLLLEKKKNQRQPDQLPCLHDASRARAA